MIVWVGLLFVLLLRLLCWGLFDLGFVVGCGVWLFGLDWIVVVCCCGFVLGCLFNCLFVLM